VNIKVRDRYTLPEAKRWDHLTNTLAYLQNYFELKFKKGLREAFLFFNDNKNGDVSEVEWVTGLQKLGLDCITQEEAKMTFAYLDSDNSGRIGSEQFKNIMFNERPPPP
jgi:Ca2+-binding EF-hand superfamily protein